MTGESPEVISAFRSLNTLYASRRRGGTKHRAVASAGSLFFLPLALFVNKNADSIAQQQRKSAAA